MDTTRHHSVYRTESLKNYHSSQNGYRGNEEIRWFGPKINKVTGIELILVHHQLHPTISIHSNLQILHKPYFYQFNYNCCPSKFLFPVHCAESLVNFLIFIRRLQYWTYTHFTQRTQKLCSLLSKNSQIQKPCVVWSLYYVKHLEQANVCWQKD